MILYLSRQTIMQPSNDALKLELIARIANHTHEELKNNYSPACEC